VDGLFNTDIIPSAWMDMMDKKRAGMSIFFKAHQRFG
jgi:hypothetical protein